MQQPRVYLLEKQAEPINQGQKHTKGGTKDGEYYAKKDF